jgi:hypothetical protein
MSTTIEFSLNFRAIRLAVSAKIWTLEVSPLNNPAFGNNLEPGVTQPTADRDPHAKNLLTPME